MDDLKAEKLEDCSDGEEGRRKSESIFLVLMHECGVKEIQCRARCVYPQLAKLELFDNTTLRHYL